MSVSLAVLGPLRVAGPAGPVRLRPAQRRLLSILLLDPEAELPRDLLVDRMWADSAPATATTSLHVHVSGLRKSVPGLIETTPVGYRVDLTGRRFDRRDFDRLAGDAFDLSRVGDWSAALRQAGAALELWRGPPFDELLGDDYAAPNVSALSDRRLRLLELRAQALVAIGRPHEAVQQLTELVQHNPLHEPLWEQLMLALMQSGRRAEALRSFQHARRIMAEELAVEPGDRLRQLEEQMLAADPALPAAGPAGPTHNLPVSATSFVGREEDVRQLTVLLDGERLVTIVGGPGFGKTRLASEVGRQLVEANRGGAWFVSLAEARNPLEVVGAIVAATGLREHVRSLPYVAARLARRAGVLILDNCEHQLEICADFVRHSLAAGSELKFLVTSRRPLGVEGERAWRIDPLASPHAEAEPAAASAPIDDGRPAETSAAHLPVAYASPAVRLFVDRARAVDRTFRLTPQTAPAVAELCRRAGGIPLALELAARWVPALGLNDIAEILSGEPPGLSAGVVDHHRSLAAAIEWSMALLPLEDQKLFLRLAVFNGRFALEDAGAVCAPDRERRRLAHAVAGLADSSLIVVERQADGSALYRTLVPIREYALGRLAGSDEWAETQLRFAQHYLRQSFRDARDPLAQVVDLERVDRNMDNLRQAFEIGLERGLADDVVSMIVQLDGYMLNRYLIAERRFWIERALEHVTDVASRAHALRTLGSGAQVLKELDVSLDCFMQALPLFRQLGDGGALAQCLLSLSGLHSMRGEWSAGLAAAHEARQLAAEMDSVSGLAVAAYYVGENLGYRGDIGAGLLELEKAARLFERAGELGRASYSLSTLTILAVLDGREEVAREAAFRAQSLAEASKSSYRRVRALGATGLFEARYGDAARSAAMLGEAHGLMEPYEMDDVFLFLLPSAFLLRRMGRCRLVLDVLSAAERAMAEIGVGCPRPWMESTRVLMQEAEAALGAAAVPAAESGVAKSIELVTAEVQQVFALRSSMQAQAEAQA